MIYSHKLLRPLFPPFQESQRPPAPDQRLMVPCGKQIRITKQTNKHGQYSKLKKTAVQAYST